VGWCKCVLTVVLGECRLRAKGHAPVEARALIAELLGRQVRTRQDGAAVFARLEIDEVVLLASAAKSLAVEDFKVGGSLRTL
jgi:hypothetical protein